MQKLTSLPAVGSAEWTRRRNEILRQARRAAPRRGEGTEGFTVRVPTALWVAAKTLCLHFQNTVSTFVRAAVAEKLRWLEVAVHRTPPCEQEIPVMEDSLLPRN